MSLGIALSRGILAFDITAREALVETMSRAHS